ncbi:MAG: hypothetical protein H6831_00870 [Planctomycetes bacterium]|nr:hypothetical protein [Planctomycetota bacterium]
MTDLDGDCTLLVSEGTDAIRVSAQGYVSGVHFLREGQTRLDIVLYSEASMLVRIEDSRSGMPVEGARVTVSYLYADLDKNFGSTDDLGGIGPVVVPDDEIFGVHVSAEGYVDSFFKASTVNTPPGVPLEVTFAVESGVTPQVVVTDARTGSPVPGATVRPRYFSDGRAWRSDSQGVVTVSAAVPEPHQAAAGESKYLVEVSAEGYCELVVDLVSGLDEDRVQVPLVEDSSVCIRAVPGPEVGAPRRPIYVIYKTEPRGRGRVAHDGDRLDWPEYVSWAAGPYFVRQEVLLDANGRAIIGNIPPGLFGFDLFRLPEGGVLLGEVGPFVGAGEYREVLISL